MRSPVGEEHVELAWMRLGRDLARARSSSPSVVSPIAETVADDADAALARVDEALRDVLDLVGIGDRRAAELHDDGLRAPAQAPRSSRRFVAVTYGYRCARAAQGDAHRARLRRAVARPRALARRAADALRAHGSRLVRQARPPSIPPITVPAWSCMMSSKTPGDLGVYGFRNRSDHTYDGGFIAMSTAIKEPRLWDLVTRAGRLVDRALGSRLLPAAAAERRHGRVLPDAVARLEVHLSGRAEGRDRARSSASTSSTRRTSARTTRSTSSGRSTR